MGVLGLSGILTGLLLWGLVPLHGWDGLPAGLDSRKGTGSNGSTEWQVFAWGDGKDLQIFMAQAERLRDPALWQRVLYDGLSVIPDWERRSLLMEFEERFGRWIQQEWEGNVPKAPLEDLVRELGKANHTYVLRTNDTGDTLFDDRGDPLFKGMEGFESDELAWKQQIEAKREAILAWWERQARTECQELLSSFSPSMKDLAEKQLSVCLAEYKKGVEREFDRLIQQGSTRFLQARLQDNFSLRRKSEGATAQAVAVSLITKTEQDLRTATQRMLGQLPGIPGVDEGLPEGRLDPAQWQEEFKQEFERGMALWKKAEERFFQERLLWEQKAQNSYLESEKAWEQTFEEFAKRRETWIGEMRTLLETGRKAWQDQQEALQKEYGRTMEMAAASVSSELAKFQQDAESRLSIYTKSLELVEMAEENGSLIQGEIERLTGRVGDLNHEIAAFQSEVSSKEAKVESILMDPPFRFRSYQDPDGVEYTIFELDWAKRKLYGDFIEFLDRSGYELVWFAYSDGSDSQSYEPGVQGDVPWASVRLFNEGAYKEELSSLRAEIQALEDRELIPRLSERDEILNRKVPLLQEDLSYWMGKGGIRDQFEASRIDALRSLYDLASEATAYGTDEWGTSSLDREITRLQQVLKLEREQLAIALDVLAYAQDKSSNRPTEAETASALEQAQAGFEKAEEEYRNALSRLEIHLSTIVETSQQEVSRKKEELAAAITTLEEARKAYEEALSVYRSGNSTILSALIDEYGRKISTYYGEGQGSRASAWEQYVAGMEYLHRQEMAQQAAQIVQDLEGEGDFDEFTDLSILRQRVTDLQPLSIPWDDRAGGASKVEPSDSKVEPSEFALQLTMAGVGKEKVEALKELFRLGNEGNDLARWKAETVLEGVKQEATLSLFQAEQIRQFLLLYPLRAEEGAIYLEDLAKQEQEAEVLYWISRLKREREALSFLLDGNPEVGREAQELAALIRSYVDPSYAADRNRLEELEQVEAFIREPETLHAETLREIGSRSPFSRTLSGNGLELDDPESDAGGDDGEWNGDDRTVSFTLGLPYPDSGGTVPESANLSGIDLVELFCGTEWLTWEKARLRSEIAQQYGPLSRVLASYERKELSASIEEAFERTLNGASITSRDGLLSFLRALPNPESLPDYLFEALSRVTVLSIFIQGQDPVALSQRVLTEITGSSLDPGDTSEESITFYVESLVKAAGNLNLGTGSPGNGTLSISSAEVDVAAYKKILQKALEVYRQENALPGVTSGEARSRRDAALGGEREILKWMEAKDRLSEEMNILQAGKDSFKEQVLDRKQMDLDRSSSTVEQCRQSYTEALNQFSKATKAYEVLLSQVNEAKSRYEQARFERDRAEAMYQYASTGYTLPGFTPEEIVADRSRRVEDMQRVLYRLKDLKTLGQEAFMDRMDSVYRATMLQEQSWMECMQYLKKAEEALQKETASLQGQIQQLVSSMEYQIRKVFEFRSYRESSEGDGMCFLIDPVYIATHSLTDLRTEDEALFAERVRNYFEGDSIEVSKRFSSDAVQWMDRLLSQKDPDTLLRQFGLAYYFDTVVQGDLQIEGAPSLVSSLLQDPSWNKLLNDYVDLGPVALPIYDGLGDDAVIVGYETWYPEKLWTVGDYLAAKTGELFQEIRSNGELWQLYSFFKMMVATQNMKVGTTWMGKDLGDLVFAHVDTPAEKKQKTYLKWWRFWTHAEGRRIRALREDIAHVHDTGEVEREDLLKQMRSIVDLERLRSSQQATLDHLASSGKPLTLEGFLSLLEKQTGSPVDPSWARTIGEVFQTVDEGQKRDSLSFLEAVQQGILNRAHYSQTVAEERAISLSNERGALYDRYRTLLEQVKTGMVEESTAREELENLVESLYRNPSFTWDDHYSWSLQLVETLEASSRSGWALKLEALAERAIALFRGRMETILEQERLQAYGEFSLLKEKQKQWEAQMETLFQTGAIQWKDQLVKLYGMRKRWQEEYVDTFEEQKRLYEGKYTLLVQNRQEWIQMLCKEAVAAATEGVGRQLGLERDRLLSELDQVRIPDLSFETYGTPQETLRRIVQDAFGGQGLDQALAQASWITGRIGKEKPILTAFLPRLRDTSETLKQAQGFTDTIGAEIYRKASLVAALKMGTVVEDAQSDVQQKILEANQSVERNVTETLRGAGYKQDGRLFVRRAVIDETLLGGIEREKQEIEGYRYFQAPTFKLNVDLSRGALEGKNGDYIQAMVRVAQQELARYLELVFGRKRDAPWNWEGFDDLKSLFLEAEKAYQNSTGFLRKGSDGAFLNQADGLFHWHVGYVPLMDPANPEAVKEQGYGEMGRIFTLFFRNQARQQRGLSSFDVAWYNRKLWDDDQDNDGKSDGFFGSPTIRSLTNLAVSVASTALMSPWVAAALNLADDALFTAMDVGNGSLRWSDGMQNLGKQAGVSALSMGIGIGSASLDQALDFGKGMGGALLEVGTDLGITSMKTMALSYGTGALEALSKGGRTICLDWNDVGSTLGVELVRTGVQSGLQGTLRGYVGQTLAYGSSLNNLVGNLSANAMEYALKGTTQFNVINASMLGGEVSGGLLEFSLGGEGGVRFSLGQGGTDISLGTLSQSLRGLDAYYQNYRIVKSGIRDDLATAMRVLYSNGQENGRQLYEEILQGKSRIQQEQNVDYEARTDWDAEHHMRVVRINTAGAYSKEGKNSDLELGIVLSHESFRNGRDDGEELQKYETEQAVRGHMAVATQVALAYGTEVLNERLRHEVDLFKATLASGSMEALQTYISRGYESTKDYWKLLRDGTLINDGKGRLLIEILNDDGTRGWQLVEGSENEHSVAAALVHYLGNERALKLLGSNPTNIDLYDAQTLKDVLKVSDQEIQMMQRNPLYAANRLKGIGEEKLEKLVGEALMKKAGIRWDAVKKTWEGEGTGIRITDSILPGNAAIRSLGGKEYERFSITTEIVRREGAYTVWMDGNPGSVGSGNTSIIVRKWNLDSGTVMQTYRAEGAWNSVDNSYGQKDRNGNPIGVNQPYQLVGGPLVQGNTLAAGDLNLRWAQNDSRNFKEVLIMSDTKTISGERILSSGFGEDHPAEGKWLVHYTGYGTSDGCIVSVGEESMRKLMTALKSMGATRGYVISSKLEDRNRFVQGPGYKKGNW